MNARIVGQTNGHMNTRVIGVYEVADTEEPCHLIELTVSGTGTFDVGTITQPDPAAPESDWQVPYGEYLLDLTGASGKRLAVGEALAVQGEVRMAFFFHYLVLTRPLRTPGGSAPLPPVTRRPARLGFMRYQTPC